MKYVFHLPNYVPYSNGIKSLWYAAYLFSKNREVYVHPYNGGEIEKYEAPINYKKLINKNKIIERDDIVVYPDMVKGNPLNAKRVARYLMAKPYILNGEGVEKGESDFLFSFSYAVDRNLPQLNTLLPELKKLAKYKVDNKNKKVVIYYGKCRISLAKTAIKEIIKGFQAGERNQVLLGVTGSGKTFTVAQVIQQLQRPSLVMAPNKILAAQLYSEMKEFFPNNYKTDILLVVDDNDVDDTHTS